MPWQDTVFLLGNLTSAIVLLPTAIDSSSTVPRRTSIPTTVVLYAFCFTFFTLDLLLSSGSSFLAATMWLFISIYRSPDESVSIGELLSQITD